MSFINTNSFSVIGCESQTIQFVLKKHEKININKKYLISASSDELREIIYNKMNLILNRNSQENSNKNLIKVDNVSIVNLKNTKSNIEYICLSKGGKIMIINPSFYNNLYIKLDSLLAFNNGIEIYLDKEKNKKLDTFFFYRNILRRNNFGRNIYSYDFSSEAEFYLIKPKLNLNINKQNENIQDLSSFIFDKNNLINDLVFISGKGPLFEKRLGEGESLILSATSLIAFEGSISFEIISLRRNFFDNYVNGFNHLIIKGPGLIIFEPNEKVSYEKINKNKKFIVILFLILLCLTFLPVLFFGLL